ncbi:MAG: HEPN domain-containing protein [Ignisphaera sp.]
MQSYDLVLFHVEQTITVLCKISVVQEAGRFPKIYSIVRLLKIIAKIYGSKELENTISSSIELLTSSRNPISRQDIFLENTTLRSLDKL